VLCTLQPSKAAVDLALDVLGSPLSMVFRRFVSRGVELSTHREPIVFRVAAAITARLTRRDSQRRRSLASVL